MGPSECDTSTIRLGSRAGNSAPAVNLALRETGGRARASGVSPIPASGDTRLRRGPHEHRDAPAAPHIIEFSRSSTWTIPSTGSSPGSSPLSKGQGVRPPPDYRRTMASDELLATVEAF